MARGGPSQPGREGSWSRRPLAQAIRNGILCYVLGPIIRHYTRPQVLGAETLDELGFPVIFAANHSSHLDTPLILRALPRRWRRHTAVVAAADYFYRNALVAGLVSLSFGTIPIERKPGGPKGSAERLDGVVRESWNLLLYPEGTRSRDGRMGRIRSGAARLAVDHSIPIVPIHVLGSHDAMPPGKAWLKSHPVVIRFGEPIRPVPGEDPRAVTERLQGALEKMRADGEART